MARNITRNKLLIDGKELEGTISVRVESIDVTPMSEPDPDWTFTDSNGHRHYRKDGDLPTLIVVEEEPFFCVDCQDEHTFSHYECRECGEEISPGTRSPQFKKFVPGVEYISASIVGDPGETFDLTYGDTALKFEKVSQTYTKDEPVLTEYVGWRNDA